MAASPMQLSHTVKSSWPVPKELKVAELAVKTIEMAAPAVSQAVLRVPTFLTSTGVCRIGDGLHGAKLWAMVKDHVFFGENPIEMDDLGLPSGKLTVCHGKSPFPSVGISTINGQC